MTDDYVESEKARIDGLIKELQAEKRAVVKETGEKRPELTDMAKSRMIEMSMGAFIHSVLGGRKGFGMKAGVPSWQTGATFEIHGLGGLDHEELYALAQTEFGWDTPRDGQPVFTTEVTVCNEHLDCLILQVDTFWSDHDWKKIAEWEKPE